MGGGALQRAPAGARNSARIYVRPSGGDRSEIFSDNGDPELTWDNWASVVLSNALIFCPYNAFAVDTFKPANGEMTSSHLLKMLDKRVVHGSAA